MRITWRRVSLALPGLMLACSLSSNDDSGSSGSSSRNGSNSSGSGGCSPSRSSFDVAERGDVNGAPDDPGFASADAGPPSARPGDPAPTGQAWKPVATDEGCGRMGITWVLVDEMCGDGEGNDDPDAFVAPMFRDGAILDNHLFAVDATHLWSFDVSKADDRARTSLRTGFGTPLAVSTRGSELVMAAGADGLVMVDTTNPASPTRSRSVTLAGKALDVATSGDKAWVAMGSAGLAEVDLASASPAVTHSWPIGGFSAGVAARGNYAYVAACNTFKVVDLSSGQVVSQAWVSNPIVGGRLVAPAKKVTLLGDVAFVAAGQYGAVAIDVSDPTQPSVLGNCTVPGDPAFYASGVRAAAGKLYVAGGEWGILSVDASAPAAACSKLMAKTDPVAVPEPSCTSKPPWEIVPWEKIWSAPPPGKDPIQTLPSGDRVYAFGDARRVGVRAVDVRDALDVTLPVVRRFDEPRTLLGIAATPGRVVTVGPRGGVFTVGQDGSLTRTVTAADATLRADTAVATLGDGRWVAIGPRRLDVEGQGSPLVIDDESSLAVVSGSKVAVASRELETIDLASGKREKPNLVDVAHLPLSVAADSSGIYYAAPEWTASARLANGTNGKIPAHTLFDDASILDESAWRTRLPRRHLLPTNHGLVEVAGVGQYAGVARHDNGAIAKAPLPALTYAAAATDGEHVYLAGIDRGLYRSYLVSVDISGSLPVVRDVESFSGAASSVAAAGGQVFVTDADGVIRTYRTADDGSAKLQATTEVTP